MQFQRGQNLDRTVVRVPRWVALALPSEGRQPVYRNTKGAAPRSSRKRRSASKGSTRRGGCCCHPRVCNCFCRCRLACCCLPPAAVFVWRTCTACMCAAAFLGFRLLFSLARDRPASRRRSCQQQQQQHGSAATAAGSSSRPAAPGQLGCSQPADYPPGPGPTWPGPTLNSTAYCGPGLNIGPGPNLGPKTGDQP